MTRDEFYLLLESWENIRILVGYLIDYRQQIEDLINIGLNDRSKESWRAIWIADRIHEKRPELIQPYIESFILSLPQTNNESKLRHQLKLISLNPIPHKHHSFLFDYCLKLFTNPGKTIAVRVHSMQILFELSEAEPALKPELIQLIEHEIEYHESAGIKSRGNKLLKKLYKKVEQS